MCSDENTLILTSLPRQPYILYLPFDGSFYLFGKPSKSLVQHLLRRLFEFTAAFINQLLLSRLLLRDGRYRPTVRRLLPILVRIVTEGVIALYR
jgi:hypothetical protein